MKEDPEYANRKLSALMEQRLLQIYNDANRKDWAVFWVKHAAALERRGMIIMDEPTGSYYVTDKGIDYLKKKELI